MTESTPPVSPARPVNVLQPARGDVKATILDVTGSLRNVPRTVRIEGIVTAKNSDGSTTIATEKGEVRAFIRSPQPVPEGQTVEVDVQAGKPPRQAILRVTDTAPQQQQSTPSSSNSTSQPSLNPPRAATAQPGVTASSSPPSPSVSQTQTPAQATATQIQPAQTSPSSAPPLSLQTATAQPLTVDVPDAVQPTTSFPLQPGQPVRLLPLPAGQPVLPLPPAQTLEVIAAQLPPLPPSAITALPSAAITLPAFTTTRLPSTPVHDPLALFFNPGAQITVPGLSPDGLFKLSIPTLLPAAGPSLLPTRQGPLSTIALTPAPDTMPNAGLSASAVFPRPSVIDGQVQTLQPDPGHLIVQTGMMVRPSAILSPLPPALSQAGALTGTVEGFTQQGLPVVSLVQPGETAARSFVLQFHASNLTVGSQIALIPQPAAGTFAVSASPAAFDPLDMAWSGWPALQEASATLAQASPHMAQTLAQIAPNPSLPQQLPAAALLFIAAIRSGDFESWIGPKAMDLLRKTDKTDLVGRLTRDAASIGRASSEPVAQDWRPIPLPFYNDGQMQGMMLWYRRDDSQKDENDSKTERKTRFVFDLRLNRMGQVQLDGLAKGQRIDLILRTTKPISSAMRQDMRQKYLNALDRAQFTGELSFQDKAEQFVEIGKTSVSKLIPYSINN